MTTTRTPGPWRAEDCVDDEYDISAPGGWCVATVRDGCPGGRGAKSVDEGVTGANADFIARACNAHDDLLAACEAAVAWPTSDDPQTGCEAADVLLRAAIARALLADLDATPPVQETPHE